MKQRGHQMLPDIKRSIQAYYRYLSADPRHRYRSWEHCYKFFQKHRELTSDDDLDHACLHLAFYLASWGMYRGSSFLLSKDYCVHMPAIREILKSEYETLWSAEELVLSGSRSHEGALFQLVDNLRQAYTKVVDTVDGVPTTVSPTDTLITKILLGTFACTPAYDTIFVEGVRRVGVFSGVFGRRSYRGLMRFCRDHWADFCSAQAEIALHGVHYPIMKLTDMYFWSIGNDLVAKARKDFD